MFNEQNTKCKLKIINYSNFSGCFFLCMRSTITLAFIFIIGDIMAKDRKAFQDTLQAIETQQISSELLDMKNLELTDADIIQLTLALSKNISITSLNLWYNKITQRGIEALAKNNTLRRLNVGGNAIGDRGATAFSENTSITSLSLERAEISNSGAISLAKIFSLISLTLTENHIGDKGAIAFAQHPSLISLNLTNNNIGDKGAIAFQHSSLMSLNLARNNIGDKGTEALAQNPFLMSLNLSGNKAISIQGIEFLAGNSTLHELILRSNSVNAKATAMLAENTTLTSLDLSSTEIGVDGIMSLSENTTLTVLTLNFVALGPASTSLKQLITTALSRNRHNAERFLSFCQQGNISVAQEVLRDKIVSPYCQQRTYMHNVSEYGYGSERQIEFEQRDLNGIGDPFYGRFEQTSAPGDSFYSALHLAVIHGHHDLVAWLSQTYPQLARMRDKDQKTALDLAKANKDETMITILERETVVDKSPLLVMSIFDPKENRPITNDTNVVNNEPNHSNRCCMIL